MGSKVVPGMEISWLIKFSPYAKKDYNYDLEIVTEREKFVVPIRAIGQKALLEFPDKIEFGSCPVKYATEKPVLLRNIGEKSTKWKILTNPPFSVDNNEGFIEENKTDQVIVTFLPTESNIYPDYLILQYDVNLKATVPI